MQEAKKIGDQLLNWLIDRKHASRRMWIITPLYFLLLVFNLYFSNEVLLVTRLAGFVLLFCLMTLFLAIGVDDPETKNTED